MPECELATVGRVLWSEDDDAWRGSLNGFTFLLGYEGNVSPAEDLADYAFAMLSQGDVLIAKVEAAREIALREHPTAREEIVGLRLGVLYFYRHKHHLRVLGDLDGGIDGRAWRVEFLGDHCEGIGFDS